MKEILLSMLFIVLISGQKWWHPNEEKNEIEVTKKGVGYTGDTKESKKYGCVCMCCHADDLPQYKCVIIPRNNYNFDIPAAANALSKRHREIRRNSYANHVINNWKDVKYSNNVQNCDTSDIFGSNVNH